MVKLKPLVTVCKAFIFLVVVAVMLAALWLGRGERSLEWARPMIDRAVNSSSSPYVISFGNVTINWRNLANFGLLRVERVSVAGRDGAVFATLPELYVGLDPFGFMPNRRSLNTIVIRKPRLFMTRNVEGQVLLGLEGTEGMPLANLSGEKKANKAWDGHLPFRHLRLEHMMLVLNDEAAGKKLESSDASLVLHRAFGRYEGRLTMPFTYGKKEGSLNATIDSVRRGQHVLAATFNRVPMDYGCMLASCPKGTDVRGLLNGELQLALTDTFGIQAFAADLTTGKKTTITAPEWFPEPLVLAPSQIQARADEALKVTELTKLNLALADTNITGTATAEHKSDGWYVTGDATADHLNIDKLYKYWPISLASDSRTWVTSSLKGGYGEQSNIKINLKPEDFKNPLLLEEAIDATVNARDLTVEYLPGFPVVNHVNALVKFSSSTITVDGTSGSMLTGTNLSKALVKFPDLNQTGTPMEIEIALKAPAADAATLLALEHFQFDDSLKLNPATLKGTVDGTLKFKFDAFSKDKPGAADVPEGEISFDNVGYDIDTTMTDISQPKFIGKFDLSGASGKLLASNIGMSFDGGIKVGDHTLGVKVAQKSGEDVMLTLDGSINRTQFAALGLPDDSRFGEGSLKIAGKVTAKKDDLIVTEGAIDLTDMAFSIPEISWNKKRGTPANINLVPKEKGYGLNIKAPGLTVNNATITLSSDAGVSALKLPRVKTDKSDFSLDYKVTKAGFDATLKGARLDASASYNGTSEDSENNILKDFPAINLTLDLAELVLVPTMPLTNVKGTLRCGENYCESADISAIAGKSNIKATISRPEGARQFALTASDAGDFLRALDITDRMFGGDLTLKGDYDDSQSPPALPARLLISSFTLRNSQILGRILSIGSLTGLANALTGSGIAFDKMSAEIYSKAGLITVRDGKASGNAIGITVGGTVDTTASSLNLRGALVPAYALNTFISRIPLIGMLAGGDEGLIAFNYSVKGPYADPSIFVNPFSGFTPGFLRGIWGSNQPDNPVDEKTAKQGSATAAPAPTAATPVRRHQRGIGQ